MMGPRRALRFFVGRDEAALLSTEARNQYWRRITDHMAMTLTLVAIAQYPWTVSVVGGSLSAYLIATAVFLLLEAAAGRVILAGEGRQKAADG